MPFPIVLPGKGFGTDTADKRAFIRVGTEMGSKIVCTCEFLGAEVALEGGRVLLYTFLRSSGRRAVGVCKLKDVVSIGDGICR